MFVSQNKLFLSAFNLEYNFSKYLTNSYINLFTTKTVDGTDYKYSIVSNGNQLDSLVISQNGSQIRRYDYKNKRGEVSLLIDIVGNTRSFYVVSPETLDSTFSKLFLLNIPEDEFFSLIKDEYPFYRIFKIN